MSYEDKAAKIRRIKELGEQRNRLLDELSASLAIQSLWPEAFDHGRIAVTFEGPTPIINLGMGQGQARDFRRVKVCITREDGERREFPFLDVPDILQRDFAAEINQDIFTGWKRKGEGINAL